MEQRCPVLGEARSARNWQGDSQRGKRELCHALSVKHLGVAEGASIFRGGAGSKGSSLFFLRGGALSSHAGAKASFSFGGAFATVCRSPEFVILLFSWGKAAHPL